jgi:hypothetical protein
LQAVAAEIGVALPLYCSLDQATTLDELRSIKAIIEQAIADADEAARQKLCKMGRCPMGYKWQPEGHGWRCEGGQHFVDASEIGKYCE